jgi:hypothetical protein
MGRSSIVERRIRTPLQTRMIDTIRILGILEGLLAFDLYGLTMKITSERLVTGTSHGAR